MGRFAERLVGSSAECNYESSVFRSLFSSPPSDTVQTRGRIGKGLLPFLSGTFMVLCLTTLSSLTGFTNEAQAQTMATAGVAGVSPGGAATYAVPLAVPPGIAGLSPKLSLQYSSQGGNGLLGVGWSLSGLSAITRCPMTRATDGSPSGVNYTASDRFCMDGQRLVVSSGTYGASGATYRTELDSLSLVTSNGTAGAGPASFTVKTKAGLTLQYGATSDSAVTVLGSSTVRVWALNKVSDSVGNFMTVAYTGDPVNGSYYPANISYTGNGSQAPTNSVVFGYIARADQIPLYTGGAVVKNTQLLSTIKTYANSQLVKTYQLGYKNQTFGSKLSALTSVQEVFVDGSTLPATQINWPGYLDFTSTCSSNCGQSFSTSPVSSISDATIVSQPSTNSQWQMVSGALTSDGRNDLVGYMVTGTTLQVQVWLSNGAGSFTKQTPNTSINVGSDNSGASLLIGDINGDGKPDLVIPACNTSTTRNISTGTLTVTTLAGNGDGTFGAPITTTYPNVVCNSVSSFRLSDQNGNGTSDLIWVTAAGSTVSIHAMLNNGSGVFNSPYLMNGSGGSPTPTGFTAANIQPNIYWIDLDNDGIPDLALLYMNGNSVAVQYWPGTGNGLLGSPVTKLSYTGTPGNPAYTYSANYKLQLVDLNGDGTPDLIAMGSGSSGASADVWLNTGGGQFASVQQNALNFSGVDLTSWTPNFADVNGDGIVDIVYASANAAAGAPAAYVFLGNGDGTFTQATHASAVTTVPPGGLTTGWSMVTTDTSGSGRADLLAWNSSASGMYVQTWTNAVPAPPTLVANISNGIGVSANFNYSTLSNPAVYTVGAAVSHPQINLNIPMNVVSSVTSPDGVGGVLTTSYKYSGLRTEEYTGRGLQGFASMQTTQQQGGNTVSTTTTFAQSWPLTGLPLTIVKTNSAAAGPNHQISLVSNSYNCLATSPGGVAGSCVMAAGKFYFPYSNQTSEQSWDLDGTVLPTLLTTTTFDGYGNALTTSSGTGDGFSKSTVNTYTNDTTNWFLGRLTQSVVTSATPATSATRTSSFSYNASNGLLASETIEPNQTQLCQTTSYSYDTFGNKVGATTANCTGATGTALVASRTSTSSTAATSTNTVPGQFITQSTNALNQSESHQFDNRYGQLSSLTGPNGLTTTWTFDAMGRQTLETRADGNKTQTQYLYCTGVNGGTANCPTINGAAGAFVVVSTPLAATGSQNGAYSKAYFDALGRKIRSETQGFDGSGSTTAIYQDVEYNNLGQVVGASRPYYQGQTAYWNTTAYDALGRAISTTMADGTTSSVQYSGLVTTSTNAKGQTTVTTKNSQAQVASVRDANGQLIQYVYDPFGNLLTTTDMANNVVTLTYDARGRKTQMADPDMGTWTYVYDALGELTSQTDAKGNTTTIAYDLLGRMTKRTESDLTSYWYFDSDSTGTRCSMGVGKLCQSTTSTGFSQKASFDSLGRTSSKVTNIDTAYTDSVTFDANGRVATRTYPGGIVVQYNYTALGYLQSVTRLAGGLSPSNVVLWTANTLDAEGHLLTQTLGNGLVTNQGFNAANGRITAITTGPGNSVQNATYQYDSLGNVTSRGDQTQTLTEGITYDNLNRMTSSNVNASATSYTDTFAFDNTGNITSRSDLGNYKYQTIAVLANPVTGCATNWTRIGTYCVNGQGVPATPNYVCSTPGTSLVPGTSTCTGLTTAQARFTGWTCNSGTSDGVGGCWVTTYQAATPIAWSCPGGYFLNGATNCQFAWVGGYAGPNGYRMDYDARSYSSCGAPNPGFALYSMGITTVRQSGQAHSVYSCLYTNVIAATPTYGTCSVGYNAGASCVVTTSTGKATANYACVSGQVSGTNCINVPYTVTATAPTSSCPSPSTQTNISGTCYPNSALQGLQTTYQCSNSQQNVGTQCVSNATINSRPHALSLVTVPADVTSGRFFTYDANGNRATEFWQQGDATTSNRAYTFTSFNMLQSMSNTVNGTTTSETYIFGPEHQRVKQVSSNLGTVIYLNPGNSGAVFFEKESKNDGSTELRNYVTAGGQVIAEIKQITSNANVASEQTLYFSRDNLGSTSVITDKNGAVLEQLAYEPFGKRRLPGGAQDPGNVVVDTLGQRGFTNHEQMDEMGLVNMNGRVYDPMTARFISADPTIQAPFNSQSYNRYSYGFNSPLNGTDPSGYSFFDDIGGGINNFFNSVGSTLNHWGDVIRTDPQANMVATITAAYFAGTYAYEGTALANTPTAAASGGFAGGMVSSGGDLNAGAKGAITALMFYGVGSASPYKDIKDSNGVVTTAANPIGNVLGHAAVGCISATMSGGDCGSGAVSAGVADYASNNMPGVFDSNLASRTAYVAIVGGTSSVISGGKFANGAESAAYGYLFNELMHQGTPKEAMQRSGYARTTYDDGTVCPGNGPCYSPFNKGGAQTITAGQVVDAVVAGSVLIPGAGELGMLARSLASEAQVAELMATGGTAIAGAGTSAVLRDAPRLAATYGGAASEWAKVTSSVYTGIDGFIVETHAYVNSVTKQIVEMKSKVGF